MKSILWLFYDLMALTTRLFIIMPFNMMVAKRWYIVDECTIRVNMDAFPVHIKGCRSANVLQRENRENGNGFVQVYKDGDGLFINGREVCLIDMSNIICTLYEREFVHPNVMFALKDNPHLLPKKWGSNFFACCLGAVYTSEKGVKRAWFIRNIRKSEEVLCFHDDIVKLSNGIYYNCSFMVLE